MCFSQILLQKRMETFEDGGNLAACNFSCDNGEVPQIRFVREYIDHWHAMSEKGLGMLLWGPSGSGKTFAAACMANAFLESEDRFAPGVIMTSFGTILRKCLAATPQAREEYLSRILGADLLILDDFGAERQTEYTQEQIYHVINTRYVRRKPMIVTINMTLQQLKNPQSMQEQRIFDRLLEICVPVCFDCPSLRKAKAAENLQFFRQLCGGEGVAKSDKN